MKYVKYGLITPIIFCVLAIIVIFVNIFIPPTFIMSLAPWLLLILAYLSAIFNFLIGIMMELNGGVDD